MDRRTADKAPAARRASCAAAIGRLLVHINERKTTEGGTVAVYTNITEIKQAEEEIRLANSKLEQANDLVTEKNKDWRHYPPNSRNTCLHRFIHRYLLARKKSKLRRAERS